MAGKAFEAEAARRAWPPFDLQVCSTLRGVLAEYAALFGLDALIARPGVRHHYGHVEAWGYDIALQVFIPEAARGTLLVCHGYFDHVGLFTHAIGEGLDAGYAVVAYDLPGHGLSSGAPADIPDFQHYQEVLRDVVMPLQAELPGPWVAVGQSTGGGILLEHLLTAHAAGEAPLFERVQLWAPLVRIASWSKVRLAWQVAGRFRTQVPRHFRRSSHNDAFLDMLWHRDPFQVTQVPMRWVGAMMAWEARLQQLPPCGLPVSLVQGGQDETVDWRYNVGFIRERFDVRRLNYLPEASHHLANERPDLRAQILQTLREHLLT